MKRQMFNKVIVNGSDAFLEILALSRPPIADSPIICPMCEVSERYSQLYVIDEALHCGICGVLYYGDDMDLPFE